MSWQSLTLKSGKPAVIDFSKVLYITRGKTGGATLYFNVMIQNTLKSPTPKSITVTESVAAIGKVLKSMAPQKPSPNRSQYD